jgi:hypothetical protein
MSPPLFPMQLAIRPPSQNGCRCKARRASGYGRVSHYYREGVQALRSSSNCRERYRDLLQASTSIISIARSAQRVKQALDETIEAIGSQEKPTLPQRPPGAGNNGEHLVIFGLKSLNGYPWVQMRTYTPCNCFRRI